MSAFRIQAFLNSIAVVSCAVINKAITRSGDAETYERFALTESFVEDEPRRAVWIVEFVDIKLNGFFIEEVAAWILSNFVFSSVTFTVVG